jgi:hypothetical protein
MAAINNSVTTTFGRNSSYPTCESLSSNSNHQLGVFNGRRCSSTTILPSSIDQYSKPMSVNYQTLDRQIHVNENLSWIERCKQRVTNFFKQISKSTTKQGKKKSLFNYIKFLSIRENTICRLYNLIVYTYVWEQNVPNHLYLFFYACSFSFDYWFCYCDTSIKANFIVNSKYTKVSHQRSGIFIFTSSKYFPVHSFFSSFSSSLFTIVVNLINIKPWWRRHWLYLYMYVYVYIVWANIDHQQSDRKKGEKRSRPHV